MTDTLHHPRTGEHYDATRDDRGRLLTVDGDQSDAAWLASELAADAGDWRDIGRFYGGTLLGGVLPTVLASDLICIGANERLCGWGVDWDATERLTGYGAEDAAAGTTPESMVVIDPDGDRWMLSGLRSASDNDLELRRL